MHELYLPNSCLSFKASRLSVILNVANAFEFEYGKGYSLRNELHQGKALFWQHCSFTVCTEMPENSFIMKHGYIFRPFPPRNSDELQYTPLKELYTSISTLAQTLVLTLPNNEFILKILNSTPFGRKIRKHFRPKNHKSRFSAYMSGFRALL